MSSNNMSIYDATKAGAMMVGTFALSAVCYNACSALGALQTSLDELSRIAKDIKDEDINHISSLLEKFDINLDQNIINYFKCIIKEIGEKRGYKLLVPLF